MGPRFTKSLMRKICLLSSSGLPSSFSRTQASMFVLRGHSKHQSLGLPTTSVWYHHVPGHCTTPTRTVTSPSCHPTTAATCNGLLTCCRPPLTVKLFAGVSQLSVRTCLGKALTCIDTCIHTYIRTYILYAHTDKTLIVYIYICISTYIGRESQIEIDR